jgi:hypothetical protein
MSRQLLTIKHFFMKKYLFGLAAIVFAIGAVAFTTSDVKRDNSKFTNFYFTYNGPADQENVESNWQEISQTDYLFLTCNSSDKACRLISTDVTGASFPNRKPLEVITVDKGSYQTPTGGSGVVEIKNK